MQEMSELEISLMTPLELRIFHCTLALKILPSLLKAGYGLSEAGKDIVRERIRYWRRELSFKSSEYRNLQIERIFENV